MRLVLGVLLVINVALFLWGMGHREFSDSSHSPQAELNPELMQLLPPPAARLAQVRVTADDQPATVIDTAPIAPYQPAASDAQTGERGESAAGPQCLVIGPYSSATERDRTARQLKQMNIEAQLSEDPEGRLLGYRVYQGPFANDEDLGRARRRLERNGVSDLFFIRDDAEQQYISLGFFSNQKSAQDFVRDFDLRGIKAKRRIEYATLYWLNVSDAAAIQRLQEEGALPLPGPVKKRLGDCP